MRPCLIVTVTFAFIVSGCATRTAAPVPAARAAHAPADGAVTNCRELQQPEGPVLECPAFDLIVSSGEVIPLATLSTLLPEGGVTTKETSLVVNGSRLPALRLEKQRSDGGTQVGWAAIVVVDGVERNVTCYLRPSYTEEQVCADGLSKLGKGQLRSKAG